MGLLVVVLECGGELGGGGCGVFWCGEDFGLVWCVFVVSSD